MTWVRYTVSKLAYIWHCVWVLVGSFPRMGPYMDPHLDPCFLLFLVLIKIMLCVLERFLVRVQVWVLFLVLVWIRDPWHLSRICNLKYLVEVFVSGKQKKPFVVFNKTELNRLWQSFSWFQHCAAAARNEFFVFKCEFYLTVNKL